MNEDKPTTLEEKPRNGVLVMVPKNDNIKPVLKAVVGDLLYEKIAALDGVLRNSYEGGDVWLQLARGEDIAQTVMRNASPRVVGFTGSDFIIDTVMNDDKDNAGQLIYGNYSIVRFGNDLPRELWQVSARNREAYADLTALFGKLGEAFARGDAVTFEANDRITIMRGLGTEFLNAPTLAILGSKDKSYEEVLQEVKQAGRPLSAVCEARYRHLARSILERDSDQRNFLYTLGTVTGATEGYVRQGGENLRMPIGTSDVAVEIGATFSTAAKNGLTPFERVMPTFPVYAICYKKGQAPVDIDEVRALVEKAAR